MTTPHLEITDKLAWAERKLAVHEENTAQKRRALRAWWNALHRCAAPVATRDLFLGRVMWTMKLRQQIEFAEQYAEDRRAEIAQLRADLSLENEA